MANVKTGDIATSPARTLLRLPQVLKKVPVSKSTWWAGVREGRFPRGIRLSERTTAWLESDIDALIDRLAAGQE